MAKDVASWSQPQKVDGLIGRKKVDWSIFTYGATTIPIEFHEDFARANGGVLPGRGERQPVVFVLEGQEYAGAISNADRSVPSDTIRLHFGGELKEIVTRRLRATFSRLQHKRSGDSAVDQAMVETSDEQAEYLEFYESGTPFRYRMGIAPASPTHLMLLESSFARFKQDPVEHLRVTVRRKRAEQLRELLSDSSRHTLDDFNREVWQMESSTLLRGADRKGFFFDLNLDHEQAVEIEQALSKGDLELHGNYIWGSGSGVYGPSMSDEDRIICVKRAGSILTETSLSPKQKYDQLMLLPGFGRNIASGLVMVFHPESFAIYNGAIEEAIKSNGFDVATIEEFQDAMGDLKDQLGADDFLELDWFFTRYQFMVAPKTQFWWVNQGGTYDQEAKGRYLWAPKASRTGQVLAHHAAMTQLKPGAIVFHYANGALRAVSLVLDKAVEAPRPSELPDDSWDRDGYMARVRLYELFEPLPLQKIPDQHRTAGPGPFTQAGSVKQGYLFPVTREFADVLEEASDNVASLLQNTFGLAKSWAFQISSSAYNLRGALRGTGEITCAVRQYKERIHVGHRVYVWEAGLEPELVAVGTVLTEPSSVEMPEEEKRFVTSPGKLNGVQPRVSLRIDQVLGQTVTRADLLANPTLRRLDVLAAPQASHFPLSREQATELAKVVEERRPTGLKAGTVTPSPGLARPPFRREEALADLIRVIQSKGFVYEPWQIAAYVTALRTKPFVILAGVSGTGKSKLPSLVASATGGVARIVPVKPDWTDSSEPLGYCDLQGRLRPGKVLTIAREAGGKSSEHFVCVLDEMNLARVEQYFAEILSRIEDLSVGNGTGTATGPLLTLDLSELDAHWAGQGLPPNLALVGTVNMDESTHGFSRKVLDRAFTLELSEVDLSIWETGQTDDGKQDWPLEAWMPRARRLSDLSDLRAEDRILIQRTIDELTTVNSFLSPAQLQVGYRTRDEVALFLIHASEISSAFVGAKGEKVDPLDLALQMKVLPRLAGGTGAVRTTLLRLLGWAFNGTPCRNEDEADVILTTWNDAGRPTWLPESRYPRTAARLCLMWDRLTTEGYTSFWL